MVDQKLWAVLGLLFSFVCSSRAQIVPYRLTCDLGKGTTQTFRVQSVRVWLIPSGGTCRVEVADLQGKILFKHAGSGLQVSTALGPTDTGQHFFLVQDDASPNQLFAIATRPHPQLLLSVTNGYGFWIQKACGDGRSHIWTADDAFQGDPELADVYHQDLFVPEVVLDVHDNRLIDHTSACEAYFDKRIADLRASMTAQEIAAFKNQAIRDEFRSGQVKGYVLYIAFADLYTGREQAAHEFLRQMWPPGDEERIWNWMLRKRSEGLLKRLTPSPTM